MDAYIKKLEDNTKRLLDKVDSLNSDIIFSEIQEGWNINEVLEHIYLTDKAIIYFISQPSDQISNDDEIVGEGKLKRVVAEKREYKIQSPEFLKPKGEFKSIEQFKDVFSDLRSSIITDIKNGKLKIDNRIHKHFVLGDMTILDWLNFIVYHTDRHLHQIDDILNLVEKE